MDYTRYLTKIAKTKKPSFYEGERLRSLNSILYDADKHEAMATSGALLLLVKDDSITETHSVNAKDSVVSTDKDMPEFPNYQRIVDSLMPQVKTIGRPITTKFAKTALAGIKTYKRELKAYNAENGSNMPFTLSVHNNNGVSEILPDYPAVSSQPVLFTIETGNTSDDTFYDGDKLIMTLEYIADLQRDKSIDKILWTHENPLSPTIVSTEIATFIVTPMRRM